MALVYDAASKSSPKSSPFLSRLVQPACSSTQRDIIHQQMIRSACFLLLPLQMEKPDAAGAPPAEAASSFLKSSIPAQQVLPKKQPRSMPFSIRASASALPQKQHIFLPSATQHASLHAQRELQQQKHQPNPLFLQSTDRAAPSEAAYSILPSLNPAAPHEQFQQRQHGVVESRFISSAISSLSVYRAPHFCFARVFVAGINYTRRTSCSCKPTPSVLLNVSTASSIMPKTNYPFNFRKWKRQIRTWLGSS